MILKYKGLFEVAVNSNQSLNDFSELGRYAQASVEKHAE
jgi:hypothetical protein